MGGCSGVNRHHDFFFAADSRNRETIAQRFGIGRQIGFNAEIFLRPTVGNTEPSFDFVKNQHNTILITKRPQAL